MKVFIGCDHAGFELKEFLIKKMQETNYEVIDCGPKSFSPDDDYPEFCILTAESVIKNPGSLGVVIGGSGNGEQIAANKVKGIRCALAWDVETAKLARQHNDAQVVSIGARMHTAEQAWEIVKAFLEADWSNEVRHSRRIEQILRYEQQA